jgi:hypothetical protein
MLNIWPAELAMMSGDVSSLPSCMNDIATVALWYGRCVTSVAAIAAGSTGIEAHAEISLAGCYGYENITDVSGLGVWDDTDEALGYGISGEPKFGAGPLPYIAVSSTRTDTGYSWTVVISGTDGLNPPTWQEIMNYSGSINLSYPNPANDATIGGVFYPGVNTDRVHLHSFWDLTDDNLYPWRTDGVWQIAPLMTRDEVDGEVQPRINAPAIIIETGYIGDGSCGTVKMLNTVDDLRSPNGDGTFAQMDWFDPAAYGFTKDGGGNVTGFAQYALTGKIFGMPMPTAFTNSESGLYDASFPTPPAKHDYQNYFDYRAQVWKAVKFGLASTGFGGYATVCGDDPYVDFYKWGYGEWLYDAIVRTGAQLPHCATQWTNNYQAMCLPPYAYIIQADKQTYNANNGVDNPPSMDGYFATGPTGVMAQKCAEILEILPSYDLARPAAADKFSFDEPLLVVCTDGTTLFEMALDVSDEHVPLTIDPCAANPGIWGGQSVGGFYTGCSMDTGTGALTLGTKVFEVPSDWASVSGDTATTFGKLRFSTAPAILGRMNVVSVADITAGGTNARVLVTGALTCLGLDIPQAETVDLCAVDMTVLASAVVPTRIKPWQASTVYTTGKVVIDGNGALQTCLSPGTSDVTAPTWLTVGVTSETGGSAVTWTFTLAGSFTVDTTFTVPTILTTIAAAKFIVSHAAVNTVGHVANESYEWDDNQRKGDFVVLDWLFDYRTPGQAYDLRDAVDCDSGDPITPATNNGYASWHQTQYENTTAIPYTPCKPLVVCVSPNKVVGGIDDFGTRGHTIPFPTTFLFDSRYGARWQAEVEQAQVDHLWQKPHEKCGLSAVEKWLPDDGSCAEPPDGTVFYAHFPLREARVTVPTYGGMTESDTAPTPPTGIGYGTPVTFPALDNAIYPPGMIGYDPTTGNPSGAFTVWGYMIKIENSGCSPESCRFNYAGEENLICLYPYVDEPLVPPDPPLTGLTGLT